jgi:hypothetical protein
LVGAGAVLDRIDEHGDAAVWQRYRQQRYYEIAPALASTALVRATGLVKRKWFS